MQQQQQRGIGLVSGLVIGVISLIVLGVGGLIIALSTIDPESYRNEIQQAATESLGREVVLAGAIDLEPSLTPKLTIGDVSVANTDWGQADHLLKADEISLALSLLPLLSGQLDIQSIGIDGASLELEQRGDGAVNWVLGQNDGAENGTGSLSIAVDRLSVNETSVTHRSADADPFRLAIQRATVTAPSGRAVTFEADGTVQDEAYRLTAELGTLDAIMSGAAYPFTAEIDIAEHVINADGEALSDGSYTGQIQLATDSDATSLAGLLDAELPPVGPYELSADFSAATNRLALNNIVATVDDTSLTGSFETEFSGEKPSAIIRVQSPRLDLAAFMPSADDDADAPSEEPLFDNDALLDGTALRSVNVVAELRADEVIYGAVSGEGLALDIELTDGVLRLSRAYLGVGDGVLDANAVIDGSRAAMAVDLNAVADTLDYGALLTLLGMTNEVQGTLTSSFAFKGSGATMGDLLQAANGEFMLSSSDGSIAADSLAPWVNRLLAIMLPSLSIGERQPFNCAYTNWSISGGMARARDLVVDTPRFTLAGTGGINLVEQRIDMLLRPRVKAEVPWQDAAAVRLSGPLNDVAVSPDVASLARGVSRMFLGEANPLDLFVPEVAAAPSGSADNPCLAAAAGTADDGQSDAEEEANPSSPVDRARGLLRGLIDRN